MTDPGVKAVRGLTLDAFGTILELEPPVPRLVDELRVRWGVDLEPESAARALKAEISYYRAHHLDGWDAESLAGLRRRCAAILHAELPTSIRVRVGPAELLPAMLESLRFRAFPDVVPALKRFRSEGLVLAVVSNWDVSLREAVDRCGLSGLVDHVVSSAEVGAAKPSPVPFQRALELLGLESSEVVHIGDEPDLDLAGARAAGISPVLIRRDPDRNPELTPAATPVITSLDAWSPS